MGRRWTRTVAVVVAPLAAASLAVSAGPLGAASPAPSAPGAAGRTGAAAPSSCRLGPDGQIRHVIYLQFDNTHLRRDDPNVPSDIQQMPALLHFMEGHGTVLDNDHTPLIAHTADDLVTSQTGVYGDRHGMPEANSYRYYQPRGTTDEAGSFGYWTDPVDSYSTANGLSASDHQYNLVDAAGRDAPAPWVPFTRAGCDFGSVAMANTELENDVPDVADVFGAHSPQAAEAAASNAASRGKESTIGQADFEGLAVHCAKANAVCADDPHPVTDRLPDERGGYSGYQAVFGAKYLDPVLAADGRPTNLNGQVITDANGNVGFPGYDGMQPANALAYTLDLQARGVPVTYTYLADAHDNATTGNGMGPGQPTYEAQLRADNRAFSTFFQRLDAMGITPANTLFVFGEDENDHYVGSAPTPPGCNGVTTPCSYSQLGEVGANLQGLLAGEQHVTTPFTVHSDSAPFVYLDGQPARTAPTVRAFGRGLARLTALDPYQGRQVRLTSYLADPVELRVLHMVTADPARTPTFALFANPDFYLSADGTTCTTADCEAFETDVWNHGDLAPDINRSWMAFAGPGVAHLGTSHLWASETDTRPTIMHLLGLRDDYQHQGVVLSPLLTGPARTPALGAASYPRLAAAYTAVESPVGPFGVATLTASTRGIASDHRGDATYRLVESAIGRLGVERDHLVARMIGLLEGAAFDGRAVPVAESDRLVREARSLLARADWLASHS